MSNTQNTINNPSETPVKAPAITSPNGEPAGPSGVGTFIAGVGANTIVALLQVMEDMMRVSNIYGELLVDQLHSQASVATSLGSYAKKQAEDTATQMEWQGYTAVAGGGLTSAIGLGGMVSSAGTENLDAEIEGAKSMRAYMDEPEVSTRAASNLDDEREGATEKNIRALKDRSAEELTKDADDWKGKLKSKATLGYAQPKTGVTLEDIKTSDTFKTDRETIDLLSEDQLDDVKTSYDERIKDLEKKRMDIANSHGTKWNTLIQFGSALNGTMSGFGTGFGSKYTSKAGTEEAAKDTANAALSTAQGITSETRQNVDEFNKRASEVVQLIAGISQANRLLN